MAFNMQQMRAIQQMIQAQQKQTDGLVTFRAGRLFMDDSTRTVTADKKRGKIKFTKDEQGLLHLEYYNRISSTKELDLTIFPQSARWEKVEECKDGRVYVLRMIQNNRKHFFWMQEPKDDKDDEYFTNINKLCNGESIGDATAAAGSGGAAATGANNQQSSAAQQQAALLQSFGLGTGAGGNTSASGNSGATGGGGNNSNQALTNMIMQALGGATGGTGTGGTAATGGTGGTGTNDLYGQMAAMMQQQQQAQRQAIEELKREPDLEDILDPNANGEIGALLDDEKVIEELAQHLPESMRSRDDIVEQLQSPQFQGALRRLQSAINGPQMATLLQQMGTQPPSPNAMGVRAFVNAIQPGCAPPLPPISDKKEDDKSDNKKEDDKNDKNDKSDKTDSNVDDDGDSGMTDKKN